MTMRGSNKKKVKEPDRILIAGKPDLIRCDNKVVSARYSALSFFPVAITEQFRRFANVYFLVIGGIMFLGQYTTWFDTAISPWTTLGPLVIVISVSLLVEGVSDYKRHLNDHETNNAPCTILQRADELPIQNANTRKEDVVERDINVMKGRDVAVKLNNDKNNETVQIAFQRVKRQDIRQGHFVLVKNREMVPADLVLLASSNDQGGAYIETSSIDGETNLKLRNSPALPKPVQRALRGQMAPIKERDDNEQDNDTETKQIETIDAATKRLTRISYLGRPGGISVMKHPQMKGRGPSIVASDTFEDEDEDWGNKSTSLRQRIRNLRQASQMSNSNSPKHHKKTNDFIAALLSEPPNASVHTFSGKLTLPPLLDDGICYEIPLDAENVLLRGAVIRNTEWVIGLTFFTGIDTKLVRNSFDTPSKFSQLDQLINMTVVAILIVMMLCITYLATQAVQVNQDTFDLLFYAGFNTNVTEPWPYFPVSANIEPPEWSTTTRNWIQFFLLYVTLLNNFIPLSLYVTVEMVQFFMLWLVYSDVEMYDDTTDTRALARSTIVSDLGRIEYIFSDKTGTLTQNVMRFKRCSVDGMIFGTPIQKSKNNPATANEETDMTSPFHPLRQLLVGKFKRPPLAGLEGYGQSSQDDTLETDKKLTLNSEMFLRVMSLCHTVVVEKDIDKKENISDADSATASTPKGNTSSGLKSLFKSRQRANTTDSIQSVGLESVKENAIMENNIHSPPAQPITTIDTKAMKGSDGAPAGYAYQAESPDEGALVSAASTPYGFQVIARDTSGIRLRCSHPSHLQDKSVTDRLKNKTLTLERLAMETAHDFSSDNDLDTNTGPRQNSNNDDVFEEAREETWSILAVNKFDSDRKRMSILLRSPPELGNLPIVFCKGADSSMIDPEICGKVAILNNNSDQSGGQILKAVSEDEDVAEDDDMAHLLKMQVHLGEFAKEGLRTLVLGMKVLTEEECTAWLDLYKVASTSINGREELLKQAAINIERDLHIVGATAIEDKLQKNVPDTIATLEKAGIKLWVLTGDKRETAVEIGYSTHVLTSKMHLTEVPDKGKKHVRTQMSMEFIRLIKIGRLQDYQTSALNSAGGGKFKEKVRRTATELSFLIGKCTRSFYRMRITFYSLLYRLFCLNEAAEDAIEEVAESKKEEERIIRAVERRRTVRSTAEKTIKDWLKSEEGQQYKRKSLAKVKPDEGAEDTMLASEETPKVFVRAQSAQGVLNEMAYKGSLSMPDIRELSIAHLTAHQVGAAMEKESDPIVDEDTLSLATFVPGGAGDKADYDRKKRTLLERMFAVDREVRKGRLKKHMTPEKLSAISQGETQQTHEIKKEELANNRNASRALVIEGAALKHLLGDPEFEEILFAVASNCDAVIACRVSPRQKAQLVNLVRQNVHPEPITLAIGDGANDVGMIQEAHVGIGISGKEGKQAVNASDFAIAQFRFLETLILIHGRWNFFRLSSVVLFSFYKNAVMAGTIIVFTARTLYSGTPLYDEWIVAMLNFVAAWPIVFTGFFDRCLSKEYVRKHPEVFKATRENQLITVRSLIRWVLLCFGHVFILYYFTVPQQAYGGGITPAFQGLMRNEDRDVPGDGEGGDLKSVGTVTFTCMIILMAYKVLYETRSLVHGKWPFFTCNKNEKEGWVHRHPYTWTGVSALSVFFYLFCIGTYQLVGRRGASQFSNFTLTTNHVLSTRSMSWMIILFVPIIAQTVDVVGKLYSNMFFPTQTQVHLEIEARDKMIRRRRRLRSAQNGGPVIVQPVV